VEEGIKLKISRKEQSKLLGRGFVIPWPYNALAARAV
jgi:hypothetical protein